VLVNSFILRKAQGDLGKALKGQCFHHLMILIGTARQEDLLTCSSLDPMVELLTTEFGNVP